MTCEGVGLSPGESLRKVREQLGLTIRDVEGASSMIARKYGNHSFAISLSRLSDIETKGVVPGIHKLYALSVIYRRDFYDLLKLYGIDLANGGNDVEVSGAYIKRSHRFTLLNSVPNAEMPTNVDPGFNIRVTSDVGRLIMRWGIVPIRLLERFKSRKYTYGYIGMDDLSMYPLILPGSFVQIDESLNTIVKRRWRSEYERPIYFAETRQGFACSWCELNGNLLTLTSHPMSPVPSRTLRLGSEVEVIGQVVGIAMRLDGWSTDSAPEEPKS
jgi:transcriptional regulator with XRE-family HTH domain